MERTEMSIDKWMDKEDVVHVYNGILISHKKEWSNVIGSNMDTTRGYHTKWSKSERERQILYDNVAQLSMQQNRLTDIESRRGCQGGWGEGWTWSLGLVDANYYM